jgi:hypothetical protein
MHVKPVVRAIVAFTAVATLSAALSPTGAEAASACSTPPLSQPFLPWGDPASYALVPNGAFERDTNRWQTAGDATIVAENEPFFVRSERDDSSLRLDQGGSATSRPFCVSWADPTLRFFVRNQGSLLSTLQVELLYTDELGVDRSTSLPVLAIGGWQPTIPLPLLANLTSPPLLTDGMAQVSLHFTVAGAGEWSVDDVYVDPFKTK